MIPKTSDSNRESLLLVTEKMDFDLAYFISNCGSVSFTTRKKILKNIVSGLHQLHSGNVVHRDLKPKNILLKNGKAIIADMGMARDILKPEHNPTRRMSLLVYTTCPPYCPPEGILKFSTYDTEVDIWALGCIWLEMILGYSYFKKQSPSENILCKIFPICGATYENSQSIIERCPDATLKQQALTTLQEPETFGPNLETLLRGTDTSYQELALLKRIFQLDPNSRITAAKLLCSIFFGGTATTSHSLPCVATFTSENIYSL